MKKTKQIFLRMFAVVVAQGMGMLGAGSVIGIELWQAAALAAVSGVAVVSEALARAYLTDGELSSSEINAAFSRLPDKVQQ